MKRLLIPVVVALNLLLADAVTKELAAGYLKGSAAVSVVPGWFNLAYVENRGCAWGLFQGQVWPLAVFGILAVGLILWKRRSIFGDGFWGGAAEALLLAGIVGNVIDRVARGYVIDFLDFHYGLHHFPCFNLADSFICVAVGLMFLCSFGKHSS